MLKLFEILKGRRKRLLYIKRYSEFRNPMYLKKYNKAASELRELAH